MNIDTPTKLSVPAVVPTRRAVDDELLGSGLKLDLQQQGWQVD